MGSTDSYQTEASSKRIILEDMENYKITVTRLCADVSTILHPVRKLPMTSLDLDLLLVERVDLISLTTTEGAFYGFTFAIYSFCARSLYLQLKDRDQRKQHLFMLLYMSVVMALALLGMAVDTRNAQTSYVDHADYLGGSLGYSSDIFIVSPIGVVGFVAVLLSSVMLSSIQIWRLWIIWKVLRYLLFIVVPPALSLLAYLGFQVASIVVMALSGSGLVNRLLFYGQIIPLLCIPVTIVVPIIIRILVVRRRSMKIMDQTDSSSPYTSVITILIESFALESVWMIGVIGASFPASSPVALAVYYFFADTRPFIQVPAYLLVVYRVTTRRGWKEDTAEKLTTLQWNRDGVQTTQIGARASIQVTPEDA